MPSHRVTLMAATAAALLSVPALAADPSSLRVAYDQAKALRLDRPAKTIVVGNPAIAEAVLVNAQTVYIQGRLFGNTNIIALDSSGEEILNTQVSVGSPDHAQVTLYRGPAGQLTLACSPRCESTVTLGDANVENQIKQGNDKLQNAQNGAALAGTR